MNMMTRHFSLKVFGPDLICKYMSMAIYIPPTARHFINPISATLAFLITYRTRGMRSAPLFGLILNCLMPSVYCESRLLRHLYFCLTL